MMKSTALKNGNRVWLLIWAALSCVLFLAVIPVFADLGQWDCRIKISFPGYERSETLSNLPVLVILNESLADFSYGEFASSTGGDLWFRNSNETSLLNYEIEEWDTDGDSYVWVQVPEISGTNTYIWAYWGNEDETNPPASTTNGAVWSSGYAGVWHLNDTGDFADSTANNNDGTNNGSTNVAGRAAGGQGFSGDDWICAGATGLNAHEGTVSAWAKNAGPVYGSGGNPTGNPIGGGEGYSEIVTQYDYLVTNKTELLDALGQAVAGEVVYVADDAEIDLTGEYSTVIPEAVTLASGRGRGGSEGALLFHRTNDVKGYPLSWRTPKI